jgi:hypothetical protein
MAPVSDRTSTSSPVTGWFSGAPSSFQSGNSSVMARGSITAPDRMWAPGSEPFSSTTTLISLPAFSWMFSCLRRMAGLDRPRGPAPRLYDHDVIFHRPGRARLRFTLVEHGRECTAATFWVSSVNQMLSCCVSVRPSGWRYSSPTMKSSKKRPSHPGLTLMLRQSWTKVPSKTIAVICLTKSWNAPFCGLYHSTVQFSAPIRKRRTIAVLVSDRSSPRFSASSSRPSQ